MLALVVTRLLLGGDDQQAWSRGLRLHRKLSTHILCDSFVETGLSWPGSLFIALRSMRLRCHRSPSRPVQSWPLIPSTPTATDGPTHKKTQPVGEFRLALVSATHISGAKGIRTPDLFHAMEARYQLRHSPIVPEGRSMTLPGWASKRKSEQQLMGSDQQRQPGHPQ